MIEKRTKAAKAKLVTDAVKRFDRAAEHENEMRALALEDVRFVHDDDAQWTDQAKAARENRPIMTFDKVSGAIDQVHGDHLQNRPGIKVRAVEDDDADTADVYTGLIRNIESQSNAKRAYSTAAKFALSGGFGAFRIEHDYVDNDSFDQDLMITEIPNPFAVYGDPMSQQMNKQDGQYMFLFEDMLKEDFEDKWPKAASGANESTFSATGLYKNWFGDKTIRVAEYWRKVPHTFTLYRLSDGTVSDDSIEPILDELAEPGPEGEPGVVVEATRKVEGYKIEHFLMTGTEILEEHEYPGKYFPIVFMYGKTINIEGRFVYRGIVRKAKDAQRSYNYERSNQIEQSALQPKQPYLATPAMIEGHETAWANLNTKNDPMLPFNFDQGQGPMRQPPGQPSSAMLTGLQVSSDDIKATTGIYDASMGNRSNETSGRAIQARDRQGDTATYEFAAEVSEAVELAGRILIDLIPKIYDGQRIVRIIGEDDAEESVLINESIMDMQTGQPVIKNDLSAGKYDVVMRVGPSYATKRTETSEQLSNIMAQNPQMGQILADLWLKTLDLVGGDEAIERVRKMGLREGYIEPTEEEQAEMQPDPQQQQMEEDQRQIQMRGQQAEIGKLEAENAKIWSEVEENKADALLTQMKAQTEQLALANAQNDMVGQQQILQRMMMTLGGQL